MEPQREASARLGGLDLIRVVAVAAVLLYHADDLLPGGLLGVTVFFTLSGFLITGQLWNELQTRGRIDLRRFWSRRVRRLVPPSLATVAVVAVLWPLLGYRLSAGDIVGAVLPVRNWALLGSEAGYGASPSPTSHFWSLAVEEQVYLVVPLALWGLWRLGRTRAVVGGLGVLTVASLGTGAWLASSGSLDTAYLHTGVRAGEVLAGVVLAVIIAVLPAPARSARRVLAVAGPTALLGLAWAFGVVHWPSAAVSTIGIPAAVVATGVACVAAAVRGGLLDRIGSTRPVSVVADHAYELYLVHVPVYLLITTYRTGLDGWVLLGVRLLVTAAAAVALHALTEPVRHRRWLGSGRSLAVAMVPVAVSLIAATVIVERPHLGSGAASATELSALPPSVVAPAGSPLTMPAPAVAAEPLAVSAAPVAELALSVTAPVDDRPTVWLVGDSTLRELEDPERTSTPLSSALSRDGWHVTGFVGLRALALCGERPWDEAGDGQEGRLLPAVREVIGEWYSAAPADTVVVQLGSNDLTQFTLSDAELTTCVEAFLAALPTDVEVAWVVPAFGPWCWCDVDRAHDDAVRFAALLDDIAGRDPRLRLLLDGLVVTTRSPRDVWAEDGVHATGTGRGLRVAALVDQLAAGG